MLSFRAGQAPLCLWPKALLQALHLTKNLFGLENKPLIAPFLNRKEEKFLLEVYFEGDMKYVLILYLFKLLLDNARPK